MQNRTSSLLTIYFSQYCTLNLKKNRLHICNKLSEEQRWQIDIVYLDLFLKFRKFISCEVSNRF